MQSWRTSRTSLNSAMSAAHPGRPTIWIDRSALTSVEPGANLACMMRLASLTAILCAFAGGNAAAKTVTTELFTVEVPDGWTIEDDESGAIAVMGSRIVARTPMPALLIQYCNLSACSRPCSEDTLRWSRDHGDITVSRVTRRVMPDGTVALRTNVISEPNAVSIGGLFCSPLGQVTVGFASDESREQAERVFETAFSSIAWKQKVAPAPEFVTERQRLAVRDPLPVVQTRWGEGVILPAVFGDALVRPCSRESMGLGDSYWQPTERDVYEAEQIVSAYMSEHGLDASEVHTWPNQPMPETWPDLKQFQRQYVGVIRGTKRTLYASFVPAAEARSDENWRRRPFARCDGGSDHFGIETDLTTSKVLHVAFDTCMCHIEPSR